MIIGLNLSDGLIYAEDTMSQDVKRQTVLVVDDAPDNIEVLRGILKEEYKIVAALGGARALEIAVMDPRPDIILLDVMMPEMDGYEVCRNLKSDPVTEKIPVIFVTAKGDFKDEALGLSLGAVDYLTKPVNPAIVKVRVRNHLALYDQKQELERMVKERTRALEQASKLLQRANISLKRNYLITVKVLVNLIESKEGVVPGHSRRVADHAMDLGKKIGLEENRLQNLLFASLLHDIGKIALPAPLLRKPQVMLNPREFSKMTSHSIAGELFLMPLEFFRTAGSYVRNHHERWDGKGFPDRMRKKEIPEEVRILSMVNDYDALQCGIITGRNFTRFEAREYLKRNRDTRYDPDMVDAFLELVENREEKVSPGEGVAVKSTALSPGMRIARDLVNPDGILLLAKGVLISDLIADRIREFEKTLGVKFDIFVEY